MTPEELAEAERSFALVAEILEARASGNVDTTLGNGDEDLLYALEEVEPLIARLKQELS